MDVREHLTGVIHAETQREGPGFDLTVADVERVALPGRVDFGGGELEPAETESIPTETRDPDDDYGWWDLEGGQYLVTYNESVASEGAAGEGETSDGLALTVQTRVELAERGVFHPTLQVERLPKMPVTVGAGGVEIKENARVSTVIDVAER